MNPDNSAIQTAGWDDTRTFAAPLPAAAWPRMANLLRLDVVRSVHCSGDGHPGPSMSIAEIITYLYFSRLRLDPLRPDWPERDRLILSKGHACPMLYAALARRGYFPVKDLCGLRSFSSHLQGHPDMIKTPGIDMTSGSLGNGIAIAAGMAIGARLQGLDSRFYVITGDGELSEGVIWEGVIIAAHHQLGNLTVLIDANQMQSGGTVREVSGLDNLAAKFAAFGWHSQTIDGHDLQAIDAAVQTAAQETDRPSVIECRTIKGKGIPYMEGDNSWHKRVPTAVEVDAAIASIGGMCL
jgi:transketolase